MTKIEWPDWERRFSAGSGPCRVIFQAEQAFAADDRGEQFGAPLNGRPLELVNTPKSRRKIHRTYREDRIKVDYQGRTISLRDLAAELGMVVGGVLCRYDKGLRGDDLTAPKSRGGGQGKYQHGTISMYTNRKCRCEPCVTVNRQYRRNSRAAVKAARA